MAALLARAALCDGLVVEVYEEGEMWLIESGERGARSPVRASAGLPGTSTRRRMAVAEARPPNGSSNEISGVSFSPIHRECSYLATREGCCFPGRSFYDD